MTWTLGGHHEVDITRDKFNTLLNSTEILKASMAIEEKYELVISNFLELEKDCLAVSAEYMIRCGQGYSSFFDIRSLFNRRLVNLLTSTKLYTDQIQQHVKECEPNLVEFVKKSFSEEYDSLFEYRFMEALRNYVQHRGLAVHITSHPSKRTNDIEPSFMEFQTKIYTKKSELEGDSAFKKLVFNEMPDKVELFSAVRKYIGAISRVHELIRKNIDGVASSARDKVESTIKEYAGVNAGNVVGLCAVKYEPNGHLDKIHEKIHEKIQVHLSWDDVRLQLISKNRSISNLEKRYVSGKCL